MREAIKSKRRTIRHYLRNQHFTLQRNPLASQQRSETVPDHQRQNHPIPTSHSSTWLLQAPTPYIVLLWSTSTLLTTSLVTENVLWSGRGAPLDITSRSTTVSWNSRVIATITQSPLFNSGSYQWNHVWRWKLPTPKKEIHTPTRPRRYSPVVSPTNERPLLRHSAADCPTYP